MKLTKVLLIKSTYIYASIIVYTCAFLYFLNVGLQNSETVSTEIIPEFGNKTSFLIKDISDLTLNNIFWNNEIYIIKNYLGLISLGIYPLVLLIFNGGFFGMIVGTTFSETGMTFVILHTLPHSFELIAVILSAADSIYLGIVLPLRFFGYYHKEINYRPYFENFILYTVIILMAALCETYITPKIV